MEGPGEENQSPRFQNTLNAVFIKLNSPAPKFIFITDLLFCFAMVTAGILKYNQCPLSSNIPKIMIIIGSVGCTMRLVNFFRTMFLNYFNVAYLEVFLFVVHLVVLIGGSYFVFREFKPNYDPSDKIYCNKFAYLLIFIYLAIIDIVYISLIGGFFCFLCCICFVMFVGSGENNTQKVDVEGQHNGEKKQEEI